MHCLFCKKTVPVLKRLQKQEFCSEAHRQQHDRLAVARLLEPKQEPEGLAAADFVVEKVGAAAWLAEPLARAGALLWCAAAVCLPGFDLTSGQPVPPVAPPVMGRVTAFLGRTEWLGAARERMFSTAAVCFEAGLIRGLEARPEPGPLQVVAAKPQEAPATPWRSPRKPWRARPAIGRAHREPVESPLWLEAADCHNESLAAGFTAVDPTTAEGKRGWAGVAKVRSFSMASVCFDAHKVPLPVLEAWPEPRRLHAAQAVRPAQWAQKTSAPLFAVPAVALRDSMSLREPSIVWRGEPEAGPGRHGFLLPTAGAEPRDVPARQQLSSHKGWDVRVATQRLRFQPLEFVAAPLPAPRLGLRIRVRNRWRTTRATLRVALLALPLIGTGLAMLPWGRQTFDEKIGPWLRERSAIVLEDDFGSGLSSWGGGSGWASEWRYDQAGFIQPGKLALLSASLPLSDYRMEFVGQIEKKSLGWVFRASDLRNFYAMKITIAKPGPLPRGDIVRYVMVNGVATDRVELPLPITIGNDMLYRVETTAVEDRFTTSVNGQVVDTFRDGRHPTGGVGLFSDQGEAARVLHVRVADRDDLVGRICAYLSGDSATSKPATPPIVGKGN